MKVELLDAPSPVKQKLREIEDQLIREAHEKYPNNISAACRALGMSDSKYRPRLKALGLYKPTKPKRK